MQKQSKVSEIFSTAHTTNAFGVESCPEVGQSQPYQVTEVLQRSGLINLDCFVPLARVAANRTFLYRVVEAHRMCLVYRRITGVHHNDKPNGYHKARAQLPSEKTNTSEEDED